MSHILRKGLILSALTLSLLLSGPASQAQLGTLIYDNTTNFSGGGYTPAGSTVVGGAFPGRLTVTTLDDLATLSGAGNRLTGITFSVGSFSQTAVYDIYIALSFWHGSTPAKTDKYLGTALFGPVKLNYIGGPMKGRAFLLDMEFPDNLFPEFKANATGVYYVGTSFFSPAAAQTTKQNIDDVFMVIMDTPETGASSDFFRETNNVIALDAYPNTVDASISGEYDFGGPPNPPGNFYYALYSKPSVEGRLDITGIATALDSDIPPVAFDFRPPGDPDTILFSKIITPPADGAYYFTLDDTETGTYDIGIKAANTLRTTLPNRTVASFSPTLNVNAALRGGDASNDNSVNFDDFDILASAYFTEEGDGIYNPAADFNYDGQVNFDDFIILADNYFLDGDL